MPQNETPFKNSILCDIDKRIRDNIFRLRSLKNLSQRQLGIMSGVAHIGQIEAGHACAGKHVVCKLAKALNVDPSEFYVPECTADTVAEIARVCSTLSKDGQAHILEMVKSLAVLEARLKWRE
jgi:transcriptional regulator with XRE-family HTH domain